MAAPVTVQPARDHVSLMSLRPRQQPSSRRLGAAVEVWLQARQVRDEDRMTADVTERAAREWFGYGRWSAPYWFVGMEPGGTGDGASHESWARLGGDELIDCKQHHLDCGFTRWHDGDRPATQNTWRRLIQLLLAFKGEDTSLVSAARYQSHCLGSADGETAVIELSAHHAVSMDVHVARTDHRDERIARMTQRLDEHAPAFVVFYGHTYAHEYARIVGASFGASQSLWRGGTLCVLTRHPTSRPAPTVAYWIGLGHAVREAVNGGPGTALPTVADTAKSGGPRERRIRQTKTTRLSGEPQTVAIVRDGSEAGRIEYDGWNIRVSARDARDLYRLLGAYERSRPDAFARKVNEIDAIFDAWCAASIENGAAVTTSWRKRQFVPAFREQQGALTHGCAVVEEAGTPIAYVYKVPPECAIWVPAWRDAPYRAICMRSREFARTVVL